MYCPLTVACVFLLTGFELVFVFLLGLCLPLPPPLSSDDAKAVQASGKLTQKSTKAHIRYRVGPYL